MRRAVLLASALLAVAPAAAPADVGHTVKRVVVAGSAQNEPRQVDVHLWYPSAATSGQRTVYTSQLYGKALPAQWDPLAWKLDSELAREDAAITATGTPYPVIVFSHGSVNDPIDYAPTLELIANAGFIVAAPYHTNNTQDDVRLDFINTQAGSTLFPCNDTRPAPCSRTSVPNSMADRVRDISRILDELGGWFGSRADMQRAGVLGHSRGSATALAAVGGSAAWSAPPAVNCPAAQPANGLCWPLQAEPRLKAAMGMAIAVQAIALGINLQNITVPTLLIAAELDANSTPAVSRLAYDRIPASTDKTIEILRNGVHRTFDSNYCPELQAAGAIAQASPRAILDAHTFAGIVNSPLSGRAVDYCSFASFTSPVDIRPLAATAGFPNITATSVPLTGLSADAVTPQMAQRAVDFFTAKFARIASGAVGGTVPATLSLTLGPAASFGAFTPGVNQTYEASMTATVVSSAGDATLTVADPSPFATGHLVNGTFSLPQPLQGLGTVKTYTGPVSNDRVTITFKQPIAATDALRTGTYSKTLTFTLSTTAP
jgi:predicted dienelactone hydrolase